ncbi:MFS transporter [Aeromicrobium choanae]|uniref:hypothetical protein n=1 Tax=Aeromicrobium choanae TaxID=1736691 RepID=UPI000999D28B|nr:hypothetical protein [Aeromicrobium choanae]
MRTLHPILAGHVRAVGIATRAGQGLAFAPLTPAGIARVATEDAGAASGLVNTAHQLGSAVVLAILVAVSAGAGAALSEQVRAALIGSSVLMGLSLLAAIVLVLPTRSLRAASPLVPTEENA